MTKILDNVSGTATSAVFKANPQVGTLLVSGTVESGATVTLQAAPERTGPWLNTEVVFGSPGVKNFYLTRGVYYRLTTSSVTNVDAWLGLE